MSNYLFAVTMQCVSYYVTHAALDSLHDVSKLVLWRAASNSGPHFPKKKKHKVKKIFLTFCWGPYYCHHHLSQLKTISLLLLNWNILMIFRGIVKVTRKKKSWRGGRGPEREAALPESSSRLQVCLLPTFRLQNSDSAPFLTHTLQLLLVLRTLATVFVLSDGCEGSIPIGQGDFVRCGDPQKNSRSSDSFCPFFLIRATVFWHEKM